MSKVYLAACYRTPVGKFLGSLKDVKPADLAAQLIDKALEKDGVSEKIIDEVILGNVLSGGHGQNIARQAVLKSKLGEGVPAYALNMVCGSGLKAIIDGYIKIKSGFSDVILAGGVEVMSQAGYVLPASLRSGAKMGDLDAKDIIVKDGLTDALEGYHMGITAENLAKQYDVTRKAQDDFAFNSQVKARAAKAASKFKDEIIPIDIQVKKDIQSFDHDEYINETTTPEKLAGLKPAFVKDGTVTAGNASGINDGAAIVVLASEEAVKKHKLTPLVEVIGFGEAGVDPSIMGIGPVKAIEAALTQTGLSIQDMDVIELNEAFAAQSLSVVKQLAKDLNVTEEHILNKANPNGGAIALGHPLGASGARIAVTLIHEMKREKHTYGLASLCVGGGMGVAMVVKNINM